MCLMKLEYIEEKNISNRETLDILGICIYIYVMYIHLYIIIQYAQISIEYKKLKQKHIDFNTVASVIIELLPL